MPSCQICLEKIKNSKSLTNHLRKHQITSQEYYDRFLKKLGEGYCKVHHNPTKYENITMGYKKNCSKSCGNSSRAILKRKLLRSDTYKFNLFREKVSKNQIKIWKNRSDEIVINIFKKKVRTECSRKELSNNDPRLKLSKKQKEKILNFLESSGALYGI
jgi:hypothetical protein